MTQAKPKKQSSKAPPKAERGAGKRRRKRLAAWAAGIVATVIGSIVIAAITGLWNDLRAAWPFFTQSPAVQVSAVNANQCLYGCDGGNTFVFRRNVEFSVSQMRHLGKIQNGLDGPIAYMEWLRSYGGVDVGDVDIQVTLVGNRRGGVRILDMEPVGGCTKPLTGTNVAWGGAGGGPSIGIGFDLDRPGSGARVMKDGMLSHRHYFASNTVSLNYREQQVFQIVGFTQKHYCQFKIRMRLLIGGTRQASETIGNGESPFRVTAAMSAPYHYKVEYGAGIGKSPCLGTGKSEQLFGMIRPHIFCPPR